MGQGPSLPRRPLASLESLKAHSHGDSSGEGRSPVAWTGGSFEHSQDLYKTRHYVVPRQKQNLCSWCIVVAFNKKDSQGRLSGRKTYFQKVELPKKLQRGNSLIIKVIMLLERRQKEDQKLGISTPGSIQESFLEFSLGFPPRPGCVSKGSETTCGSSCRTVTPQPEAAHTPLPWAAMGPPPCLLLFST